MYDDEEEEEEWWQSYSELKTRLTLKLFKHITLFSRIPDLKCTVL